MVVFYYDTMEIEEITLYLIATEQGLSYIKRDFAYVKNRHIDAKFIKDTSKIAAYKVQLEEYFAQKRKEFDLEFDLPYGTPFQRSVWQALLTIPYGETVSYADIAAKINRPKAVRAIGNANSKNPISIMIPCHRVLQKDGKLGGYSGGLDMKRYLLQLERHED